MSGPLNLLPNNTLLVLTPLSGQDTVVLTPYSARGLTQTLDLISGVGGANGSSSAWLRRDVNGFLRSVADNRFRKYRSVVSCRDGETPCLDGAWIGETVVVSCAVELSFPSGGFPQRPMVSGSERVQGSFIYYRPELTMIVAGISNSFQEYQAINSWSVTLEEV